MYYIKIEYIIEFIFTLDPWMNRINLFYVQLYLVNTIIKYLNVDNDFFEMLVSYR